MIRSIQRQLLALVLGTACVASPGAWAAGYGAGIIDHYDGATGLYFRTITADKMPKGLVSSYKPRTIITNLFIFNPENEASNRFFEETPKGEITDILFESGITDGQIDVISIGGGWRFKHNTGLPEGRTPRDKLLVGVKDEDTDNITLYVANKHGENRSVLTVVPAGAEWHIDAANGKLRVIREEDGKLVIESFDW